MSDWLAPIKRIFDAPTGDLRKLAEIVGADPEIFYVGRDLSKCDLKGQDLRGMNLTGAILDPASMDEDTKIDTEFDPRFKAERYYVQIGLQEEVLALALAYGDSVNYRYKAWAIKALLESGIHDVINKEVRHVIDANPKLSELAAGSRSRMRRLTVAVHPYIQEAVHEFSRLNGERYDRDSYNIVVLAALVKRYVGQRGAAPYATVEPITMFKRADWYLDQIRRGKRFMR